MIRDTLDEVLLDRFARQVGLDDFANLIPWDGDTILRADVMDGERDKLVEIGC